MTTTIIITLCVLILFAYIFDITSSKTKIPTVVFLLLLGWLVKQLSLATHLHIPNLNAVLPILGTIGLILIVLEGALELELNVSKFPLIQQSFVMASLPMLLLSFAIAAAFSYWDNVSFKQSITNAIPLCVISSAIAIPSVQNLSKHQKEFVIYESSLSDILGVVFLISWHSTLLLASIRSFILQVNW
ncbi:MAG: hypothetical protein R2822_11270 [Spirosomataceae bacterium]